MTSLKLQGQMENISGKPSDAMRKKKQAFIKDPLSLTHAVSLKPLKCSHFMDEEAEAREANSLPKMGLEAGCLMCHACGLFTSGISASLGVGEQVSGAEAPILTVRGGALPDFLGLVSCHVSCEAGFPGCFQEKGLVP